VSLRLKLSLIGLVLLVLPWTAWRLVGTTEELLRQGEQQALLATAEVLARAVAAEGRMPPMRPLPAIYAWDMGGRMALDGYGDEWRDWAHALRRYAPAGAGDDAPTVLRVGLARDDMAYYLLFQVRDTDIVYRRTPGADIAAGDHLYLIVDGDQGKRVLVVDTIAPGQVQARALDGGPAVDAVWGEWQETGDGYSVELRLPRALMHEGVGFAVADVDAGAPPVWIGTGGGGPPQAPLPIVEPQAWAHQRLASLVPASSRAWLVDTDGWVLARVGAADGDARDGSESWLRNLLYRHVLASPLQPPAERGPYRVRLGGSEVRSALGGEPATAWRTAEGGGDVVISVAQPVRGENGDPRGAVVMARSSEGVLLLTEHAMVQVLGAVLLAVGLALAALLGFAGRLSTRIRQLRDAAAGALDASGQVHPVLPQQRARDELGDLSRSFSRTLDELHQYTRYLRSLAGKLSHELRTPLAVVSSSLDNLAQTELDEHGRRYAERARSGTTRLAAILRAISEATHIEQSVRVERPEHYELDSLLRGFVDAYRDVHPSRRFEVDIEPARYRLLGVPDLIGQMLDKLVDNAVDFSPADGCIRLQLRPDTQGACLTISNPGPLLPQHMRSRLFDSLVSVRQRRDDADQRPHLGLGLYIARLIAEMHGGRITARNLADGSGVAFSVQLGSAPTG
jgi:dedicated sortase system histidine kinase